MWTSLEALGEESLGPNKEGPVLCIKRQTGSRFGEVLEGSLTCFRRKLELLGSGAKRDRVGEGIGVLVSMVSAQ